MFFILMHFPIALQQYQIYLILWIFEKLNNFKKITAVKKNFNSKAYFFQILCLTNFPFFSHRQSPKLIIIVSLNQLKANLPFCFLNQMILIAS